DVILRPAGDAHGLSPVADLRQQQILAHVGGRLLSLSACGGGVPSLLVTVQDTLLQLLSLVPGLLDRSLSAGHGLLGGRFLDRLLGLGQVLSSSLSRGAGYPGTLSFGDLVRKLTKVSDLLRASTVLLVQFGLMLGRSATGIHPAIDDGIGVRHSLGAIADVLGSLGRAHALVQITLSRINVSLVDVQVPSNGLRIQVLGPTGTELLNGLGLGGLPGDLLGIASFLGSGPLVQFSLDGLLESVLENLLSIAALGIQAGLLLEDPTELFRVFLVEVVPPLLALGVDDLALHLGNGHPLLAEVLVHEGGGLLLSGNLPLQLVYLTLGLVNNGTTFTFTATKIPAQRVQLLVVHGDLSLHAPDALLRGDATG